MSVAIFTNNPNLSAIFPSSGKLEPARPGPELLTQVNSRCRSGEKCIPIFFEACANTVLTGSRDFIHAGWRLLHHPLYGNYRPIQQPYRSVILSAPAVNPSESPNYPVDLESLHLIEEALLVYASAPALHLEKVPLALKEPCALLDCELLLPTLEQAGVIRPD